jgi:hypothetical protein
LAFHVDWKLPERTNVLFFILCRHHGQPVPFRNLYQVLREPNISSSARDTLTMAITAILEIGLTDAHWVTLSWAHRQVLSADPSFELPALY